MYQPVIKSGEEKFQFNSLPLNYSLSDFWKWNCSDLLSNAQRGRLAEFIVAMALEIDVNKPREEWAAYDLLFEDIRLEIKSASYVQSWYQSKPSKISFSIKPSRHWDPETNTYASELARQADVYVMCLLKHIDKTSIEPLDLSQWGFFVISAKDLEIQVKNQKTLSLAKLQIITKEVLFSELKSEVRERFSLAQAS